MNLGIIIQARMGSTRLPGKVLMFLGGKTLLDHILERVMLLKNEHKVIIATTKKKRDDLINEWCLSRKITCFRGEEDNVLKRYYVCAKKYKFNNIVRLTADNPFLDPSELDNLINLHLHNSYDYSNSFGQLPIGVGAEIFTIDALRKSFHFGTKDHHKEHVNEYIFDNPSGFNIGKLKIKNNKCAPRLSLTVDTKKDLERAIQVLNKSKQTYLDTEEAINICSQFA